MGRDRRRHPALDLQHPFFRPVWRRVAVMALLFVWVAMEASAGSVWWALLAGGIAAYAAYEFFVAFDPAAPSDDGAGKREEDE